MLEIIESSIHKEKLGGAVKMNPRKAEAKRAYLKVKPHL